MTHSFSRPYSELQVELVMEIVMKSLERNERGPSAKNHARSKQILAKYRFSKKDKRTELGDMAV